jgi:hypothetical protein
MRVQQLQLPVSNGRGQSPHDAEINTRATSERHNGRAFRTHALT